MYHAVLYVMYVSCSAICNCMYHAVLYVMYMYHAVLYVMYVSCCAICNVCIMLCLYFFIKEYDGRKKATNFQQENIDSKLYRYAYFIITYA